jgi:hypothetical protein
VIDQRPRLRDWLAGLLLGVVGGFGMLYMPPIGLAVLGWTLLAFRSGLAGRLAVAGALIGIGAVWVELLAGAAWRCASFGAEPGQACVGPELRTWLIVAALLITIGVGVSARTARGSR